MIRIAIVEDEQEASNKLRDYLKRYEQENSEVFSVDVFDQAIDFITEYKPKYDLIFLDIEMPHMDGMTVAKKLRECDAQVLIVFVTNMRQYAIKGYAVSALDFLVKPVTYFMVSELCRKATGILKRRAEREIVVGTNNNLRRIPLSRLKYVEVMKHKLTFYTEDGVFEDWGTLSKLMEQLPDEGFCKCHACYLVNLKHVLQVRGEEVLIGDTVLKISRNKRKEFLDALLRYIGNEVK